MTQEPLCASGRAGGPGAEQAVVVQWRRHDLAKVEVRVRSPVTARVEG